MKQKIHFIPAILFILLFVACGKKETAAQERSVIVEINQNDYRGAVTRTDAIRQNILTLMMNANSQNELVISENPSDYWTSDEYLYFTTNLISDTAYKYTIYFNEKQTDWNEVEQYTNAFFVNKETGEKYASNVSLGRESENHYLLQYNAYCTERWLEKENTNIKNEVRCTYDPNHDWAQAVLTGILSSGSYEYGLYEYARSGNAFIIQTETERLYVEYMSEEEMQQTVSENTSEVPDAEGVSDNRSDVYANMFETRPIKCFYYSKLNGEVLPWYVYSDEDIAIYENEGWNAYRTGLANGCVTVEGYLNYLYNAQHDTIFSHIGDIIGRDWVMEAGQGSFAQSIIYEDGNTMVKATNLLSSEVEVMMFYADGTSDSYTEAIRSNAQLALDIDNLEGERTRALLEVVDAEGEVVLSVRHSSDFDNVEDRIRGTRVNDILIGEKEQRGNIIYSVARCADFGSDYTASYNIYGNYLEDVIFVIRPSKSSYTQPSYGVNYYDCYQSVETKDVESIEISCWDRVTLNNQNGAFEIAISAFSDELAEESRFEEFYINGSAEGATITVSVEGTKIVIDSTKKIDFTYTYAGQEYLLSSVQNEDGTESYFIVNQDASSGGEAEGSTHMEIDFSDIFPIPEIPVPETLGSEIPQAEDE